MFCKYLTISADCTFWNIFYAIDVEETKNMNLNSFTIKAQEIVQQAQQVAFNNQNPAIETAHLLQALLDDADGPISYLLKKNNVNIPFVEGKVKELIQKLPKMPNGEPAQNVSRELNSAVLRTRKYPENIRG